MVDTGVTYVTDNSDLAITVIKVNYRGPNYIKAKCKLYNKKNGIVYEIKNYKLDRDRIKHWKSIR